MNILYDYQAFWFQKQGGISRYFSCLMNAVEEKKCFNYTNSTLFSNNNYLRNKNVTTFFPDINFSGKNTLFFGLKYLNRVNCLKLANSGDFDLFHPTYFEDYFLGKINLPIVLTFFDLTMEKYIELFNSKVVFAMEKKVLLENSTKIIAISNNTKSDLINYYEVDKNKIEVIHLSSNIEKNIAITPNNYVPEKFLLFVGARDKYKNFAFFVESISKLLIKDKDLFLVCVGKSFEEKELNLLKKLGVLSKVICISANDSELAYLYTKARLFVFPSLYEGFGIPILEAFNCGCPVVLSNASCFPEIAENAATYFDPTDSKSIKNCIEDLLSNDKKRELLIKRGFKRAKDFSWEKTALQTKKVYQKALK
jgi:glycosyltransferase involved in cell wall biosynthesis